MTNFNDLFAQADRMRNDSQVDEAIAAYSDIATLAEQEDQKKLIARALHGAGIAAKEAAISQNDYYKKAQTFFRAAKNYYELVGDNVGVGAIYRDVAMAADSVKDFTLAETSYIQSLQVLNEETDSAQLAITHDKFGLHYLAIGQTEKARQEIEEAIEVFTRDPSHGFFRATTFFDYARVLFKLGDLTKALENALLAYSWFVSDHDNEQFLYRRAQIAGLLAIIYGNINKPKEAEKYAKTYQDLVKGFPTLVFQSIQRDLDFLTK